jgi:hypothetical protein
MEFLALVRNGPVLFSVFTLVLFASNDRVVNFRHQMMKLTSTSTEVLFREFTIFADFFTNHFLNVLHVPEIGATGKLISESMPVEEV